MRILKKIFEWIWPTILVLIIMGAIKTYIVEPVVVNGPSMAPNLSNKQIIPLIKDYKLSRGDVIVFNAYPEDPKLTSNEKYVKRIIGIPGDTISSKDGSLYVNGRLVDQSYISYDQRIETGNWDLKSLATDNNWKISKKVVNKVPKNEYFVLGDNRLVSNDSRYWGFVPKNKISGRIYIPFWNSKSQQKNVNDLPNNFFKK